MSKPKRAIVRNTTLSNGQRACAIYVGRKLAATLHFPAKSGRELDAAVEAVRKLWEATHDPL